MPTASIQTPAGMYASQICHIESVTTPLYPRRVFLSVNVDHREHYRDELCPRDEMQRFQMGTESGGDFKRHCRLQLCHHRSSRSSCHWRTSPESVDGSHLDSVVVSISHGEFAHFVYPLGHRGRDMKKSVPGSPNKCSVSPNMVATGAAITRRLPVSRDTMSKM